MHKPGIISEYYLTITYSNENIHTDPSGSLSLFSYNTEISNYDNFTSFVLISKYYCIIIFSNITTFEYLNII